MNISEIWIQWIITISKNSSNNTTMKKYNNPWVVASILFALLFMSVLFNFRYANLVGKQTTYIHNIQASNYKLDEYKEALRLADILMDNNDLWDRDGSDVMSDYLNLRANMDTTFYHGFHHNALLDSLSLNYNE